jgi:hypothetical protein
VEPNGGPIGAKRPICPSTFSSSHFVPPVATPPDGNSAIPVAPLATVGASLKPIRLTAVRDPAHVASDGSRIARGGHVDSTASSGAEGSSSGAAQVADAAASSSAEVVSRRLGSHGVLTGGDAGASIPRDPAQAAAQNGNLGQGRGSVMLRPQRSRSPTPEDEAGMSAFADADEA